MATSISPVSPEAGAAALKIGPSFARMEEKFPLGLQLVLGAFDGLLVLPHVLARLVADLGELFQFGLCVDLEPGEAWDSLLAAGCVSFVRVLPDRDVLDNLVEDIQRPVLGAAGLKVHPVLADAVVLLE